MIAAAFRLIAAAFLIVGSAGLAVAQPSDAPPGDVPKSDAPPTAAPTSAGPPGDRPEAPQDPAKPADVDIDDRSDPDDVAVDPPVPAPPPRRRPPVPHPVFRAFFHVDSTQMAAMQTFDAVVGRSRLTMFGGGVEVGVWRGFFARAAASVGRQTGSRVVITEDGETLSLGIPLTVEMRPVELAMGWRPRRSPASPLVPYAGGGLLLMYYRETSEFADTDEDTDTRYPGVVAFAGLEAAIGRWVVAGAEVQYRTVKDALGTGGASAAFDEDDLGGITVRVRVGIGR